MLDVETTHHLAAGREAYAVQDYEHAEKHLRAVLTRHQGFADVHSMLGVIAFLQGRPGEARTFFEKALRLNPRYAEAALYLSICLNEAGLYDEAREVFARSVRSPRPDAAMHALDDAVAARVANLHAQLGDAYQAAGETQRALRQYEQAVEARPDFPDLRLKLAVAYRDAEQVGRALAELGTLVDEQPDYLPARLQLGITLFVAGRVSEARVQWLWVRDRAPNDPRASFYLGLAKAA